MPDRNTKLWQTKYICWPTAVLRATKCNSRTTTTSHSIPSATRLAATPFCLFYFIAFQCHSVIASHHRNTESTRRADETREQLKMVHRSMRCTVNIDAHTHMTKHETPQIRCYDKRKTYELELVRSASQTIEKGQKLCDSHNVPVNANSAHYNRWATIWSSKIQIRISLKSHLDAMIEWGAIEMHWNLFIYAEWKYEIVVTPLFRPCSCLVITCDSL